MTDIRPPGARVPPEILLRLAEAAEVPSSAKTAQRRAEAAGWAVTLTYCRGYTPESNRSHARLVDSLAVRCQRLYGTELLRAVAVWIDGKYDMGRVITPWVRLGYRDWLAGIGSWDAIVEGLKRARGDGARLPGGAHAAASGGQ